MDQLCLTPVLLLLIIQPLNAEPPDNIRVVASLYGSVTLPCSFPFIEGPEGLMVVWKKEDKDGSTVLVHKFRDSQDIVRDQDIHYTGRTEIPKNFSMGRVDLTLRDVTFRDEGTYYCRAANGRGHGDKEVKLTIRDVNADDSAVTTTYLDGKKRLKCINVGVFRNPEIKWHNMQGEDLSEYGTQSITDIGDGRKMVESVLDMDVERDTHYFCQVREGRLRRTARAVLSDKSRVVASLYDTVTLPCSFPFIEGPEGLMVVWKMKDKDGSTVLVHKSIDGQDIVHDQDFQYTGRTEISNDFSTGRLDLTLRDVTFRDEGIYYCRAANGRDHGDKEVELTIGGVSTMMVIQEPPSLNLSAGDTARMFCDVRNISAREIVQHFWNREGSREHLQDSSRVTVTPKSLTIFSVTSHDTGYYICTVRDKDLRLYTGGGTRLSVTGE